MFNRLTTRNFDDSHPPCIGRRLAFEFGAVVLMQIHMSLDQSVNRIIASWTFKDFSGAESSNYTKKAAGL